MRNFQLDIHLINLLVCSYFDLGFSGNLLPESRFSTQVSGVATGFRNAAAQQENF